MSHLQVYNDYPLENVTVNSRLSQLIGLAKLVVLRVSQLEIVALKQTFAIKVGFTVKIRQNVTQPVLKIVRWHPEGGADYRIEDLTHVEVTANVQQKSWKPKSTEAVRS